MHIITIQGRTRYAEFIYNSSTKRLSRSMKLVKEADVPRGDQLTLTINEGIVNSNLVEKIAFVYGTPAEIVETVNSTMPVMKLVSEPLFSILDHTLETRKIAILYIPYVPSSVIQRSNIYQVLQGCRAAAVASMFDLDQEDIKIVR